MEMKNGIKDGNGVFRDKLLQVLKLEYRKILRSNEIVLDSRSLSLL